MQTMQTMQAMQGQDSTLPDSTEDEIAWMLVSLRKPPPPITHVVGVDGERFEVDDMVYFPAPPDGLMADGVIVSFQDQSHAVVRFHGNAWTGSKYHVVTPVPFLRSKHRKWKRRNVART